MEEITYIARFDYCDDGICVTFPNLGHLSTCGDTKEEAIKAAIRILNTYLDMDEDEMTDIYPPSKLQQSERNGIEAGRA